MLATGSCCLKAIRWFGQHGRVIIRPGVGMQIEVPVVPQITGQAREEWVFIEAGTPKRVTLNYTQSPAGAARG